MSLTIQELSKLSSLSDYLSVIYINARTDYRLAFWLRLASPSVVIEIISSYWKMIATCAYSYITIAVEGDVKNQTK